MRKMQHWSAVSSRLMVEEPTEEQSIAILKGLRPKYEEHHKVTITDDALVAAVAPVCPLHQ